MIQSSLVKETPIIGETDPKVLQREQGVFLYEEHRKKLELAHKANLGAINIIQALAIQISEGKLDLNLEEGVKFFQARIAEVQQCMELYFALEMGLLSAPQIFSSNLIDSTLVRAVLFEGIDFLINHRIQIVLSEALNELKRQKSQKAEIIMIAGHQGVGKGVIAQALGEKGSHAITMSTNVRQTTDAWQLDSTSTIDKIISGQLLKEYFGLDILVRLGIFQSLAAGFNQLVIDGPRVLEEAQAVLVKGGILIGVVADLDPKIDAEIRKQRIIDRAEQDPNRVSDIAKFDAREAIEAANINSILSLANITLVNNSTPNQIIDQMTTALMSL
jgi:dephospho-CoA kinase